jgi:peptidoglycan/LPS O-acetylase OafA/YrhL
VVVLSPILRMGFYLSGNAGLRYASVHYVRFDFIMFGCLIALLQHTPRFEALYRVCTRVWWLPPAAMLACNLLSTKFQNYFDLTIGFTIDGIAIAVFLLWCTRNADSLVGKALNSWPMAKIGVLSYSIYLWQTLFLHKDNDAVFAFCPPLGRFPLNWLGFLLAGAASYYIVEQPSLRLRDRIIQSLRVYRQSRGKA